MRWAVWRQQSMEVRQAFMLSSRVSLEFGTKAKFLSHTMPITGKVPALFIRQEPIPVRFHDCINQKNGCWKTVWWAGTVIRACHKTSKEAPREPTIKRTAMLKASIKSYSMPVTSVIAVEKCKGPVCAEIQADKKCAKFRRNNLWPRWVFTLVCSVLLSLAQGADEAWVRTPQYTWKKPKNRVLVWVKQRSREA